MIHKFEIGDRVRIEGHWEFPNGIIGTVVMPSEFQLNLAELGEWSDHRRTVLGRKGSILFYFIQFDQPVDDGSGDGSYIGAEIEAECLHPYD